MISSPNLIDKSEKRFQNLVLATVIVIYLLVLAGGIVRGTGSGMGCPDWPRCFGRWIPPTSIEQLPQNYQQLYGAKLKGEVEFNATKTWIEYINRLLGVISGLSVVAMLIASFTYWRKDKTLVISSGVALLLIVVNGWLGSRVVATELAHYMVTIHLMLAVLLIFVLLFVFIRSQSYNLIVVRVTSLIKQRWLLGLLILITIGQITLGTQVRDALNDVVRKIGYQHRNEWISELDWRFYIHRSFSVVVLGMHLLLYFQLQKNIKAIKSLNNGLITLVALEVISGIVMANYGVPAFVQPIHLLLAILIVGIQFTIGLLSYPKLVIARGYSQPTELVKI